MDWLDKPTPEAVNAERALLGGLLMEPGRLAGVSAELEPDHLLRPEHRVLYRVMLAMMVAGEAVDLVTVAARLQAGGESDRAGGLAYVSELPEHNVSPTNLDHYVAEIRETALRRELIRIGVDLANRSYAPEGTPTSELASHAIRELCDIEASRRVDRSRWHAEVVPELLREAEDQASGAAPPPVSTGYVNRYGLDDLCGGGLHQDQLHVIAAATGMGKSGLAVSMASEMARVGRSVLYVSLELSVNDLHRRALAYLSGISTRRIRTGQLSDHDREVLDLYSPAKYRIAVCRKKQLDAIIAEARRLWSQGQLSAVFIDYMQLMHFDVGRNELLPKAMGRVCETLRDLAEELHVPVTLLAQLKAGWKERAQAAVDNPRNPRNDDQAGPWYDRFPPPTKEDVSDSSEIAKTADTVILPMHGTYLGILPNDPHDPRVDAIIRVDKNRNGPLGWAECNWDIKSGCYRPWGRA